MDKNPSAVMCRGYYTRSYLRAEFFRNIWMVEKARKNFDEDEIEILRRIYAEGRKDTQA